MAAHDLGPLAAAASNARDWAAVRDIRLRRALAAGADLQAVRDACGLSNDQVLAIAPVSSLLGAPICTESVR